MHISEFEELAGGTCQFCNKQIPNCTCDREDKLEAALRKVLSWPLPNGSVETWALPSWLAKIAHDALSESEANESLSNKLKDRIEDRIACCWLQAEGLSEALAERCKDGKYRSYLMRSDYHRDDRLLELETQAQGLAACIAELRSLARIV